MRVNIVLFAHRRGQINLDPVANDFNEKQAVQDFHEDIEPCAFQAILLELVVLLYRNAGRQASWDVISFLHF